MNVVIYARYSSSNQRDASIDQQINACKGFCKRNGYKVVDIYTDRAMTGKSDKRPSFQKMILDSAKRTFQGVVVYALDRFSRNRYDSAIYKHKLKENDVRVLSVTENITNDPTGIVVEALFEAMAEQYSAELSLKIRRGNDDNARKFLAPGSVPLGYDRSKDGRYVINEAEAEVVREIFQRFRDGEKYAEICEDLNNRGIKTSHKSKYNRSSLSRMLQNERYIGTFIYKDQRTPDVIPAIVDKTLFWEVQRIMDTNTSKKKTYRKTENGIYILTGKIFCECGSPMYGISGTGRHGDQGFYYSCKAKREKSGCEKKNVRRDYIERLVAESIKNMCLDDDAINWLADNTIEQQNRDAALEELQILKDNLKAAKQLKSNATKAILQGIINDEIREALRQAEEDEHLIEAQIKAMETASTDLLTKDQIISFLETFRDADLDLMAIRHGIIEAFVTKVELSDTQAKIYFSIKKEDRLKVVDLADQEVERGLYKPQMWSFGELIQTPVGFCMTIAA